MTNELLLRVISALLLAGFSFWWIYKASELVFLLITFALSITATFEYARAIEKKGIPSHRWALMACTVILFGSIWLHRNDFGFLALLGLGLVFLLMIGSSLTNRDQQRSLITWYLFPLVWISLPISSMFYFRFTLTNSVAPPLIILLLMIVAFNDIFAYFGGKKFGRHPLAPVISPKKTVEGALFGVLGGLIGGCLSPYLSDVLAAVFSIDKANQSVIDLLTSWKIALVVIIVVPISQFGDLVESKFKRYCGVKDSSNLIPGHGGLLDRCDAFLFAIPAFYIALLVIGLRSII